MGKLHNLVEKIRYNVRYVHAVSRWNQKLCFGIPSTFPAVRFYFAKISSLKTWNKNLSAKVFRDFPSLLRWEIVHLFFPIYNSHFDTFSCWPKYSPFSRIFVLRVSALCNIFIDMPLDIYSLKPTESCLLRHSEHSGNRNAILKFNINSFASVPTTVRRTKW